MQMLDPPNHTVRPGADTDRHNLINDMKEAYYLRQVDTFEHQCAVIFLETRTGQSLIKRTEELKKIFRRAGTLAAKLAAQKVDVQVEYLDQLPNYTENGFSNESEVMQLDYFMRGDEDDPSWNGWEIDLIVEPAILAFGDEHGENYDDWKVWTKARVWIDMDNMASMHHPNQVARQTGKNGKTSAHHDGKGNTTPKTKVTTHSIDITGDDDVVSVVKKETLSNTIKKAQSGSVQNGKPNAHQSASPKALSSSSSQAGKNPGPSSDRKTTHDSVHDASASTRSNSADRQTGKGSTLPKKAQSTLETGVDKINSSAVEAPKADSSKKRKRSPNSSSEDAAAAKEAKKQKGGTATQNAESRKEYTKQGKKDKSGQQKANTGTGNRGSSKEDTEKGKKDEPSQTTETGKET